MDPSFLTSGDFWRDASPFAEGFPGTLPSQPEMAGHVLFQTSGSTGEPKWIALSKEALLASAAAVNAHLGVDRSSCWGLALPTRHVGGFGVAARAFAAGCAFRHFEKRWSAGEFVAWLHENGVSHTSLVPTQVHDLAVSKLRAPEGLRAVVVGGGRLDNRSGKAARDLGWPVLASYGMTEAGSQIATQELASLHEIYQPAPIPLLPIWSARLSADGRLQIAGPALFSGMVSRAQGDWIYQKRPGEWHETADRVRLGPDGLTPAGRADTLVKVLGELVDPGAIECELADLTDGRLATGSFVVAAVPDERMEHALIPVFDAAVDRELVDSIIELYHARCPGFRRLGAAVVLDPLPRGPLGKPMMREILALLDAMKSKGA